MASRPSLRGERFSLDDALDLEQQASSSLTVKDVLERPSAPSKAPPMLPSPKAQDGGFPKHRNRVQQSRFKAQAAQMNKPSLAGSSLSAIEQQLRQANLDDQNDDGNGLDVHDSIDRENQQRLLNMSDEEIQKQQQELLKSLDPSILRYFSQRTDQTGRADTHSIAAESSQSHHVTDTPDLPVPIKEDGRPQSLVNAASSIFAESLPPGVHFPRPPQPSRIDDNSETFLDDLHEKFFPFLPAEPEKLAWMRAIPDNTYNADLETVHLANIRFDFKGAIVPPRSSATLPVTLGLHHHGDAAESAGYTVPELAHLARSTVPMQRCMSFQTIGRILYRLGTGFFGDRSTSVAKAIRQMVAECRILETLREAAGKGGTHLSVKAYATEALWLWQRSGGSEFRAE